MKIRRVLPNCSVCSSRRVRKFSVLQSKGKVEFVKNFQISIDRIEKRRGKESILTISFFDSSKTMEKFSLAFVMNLKSKRRLKIKKIFMNVLVN